jgi:hypothetical protein
MARTCEGLICGVVSWRELGIWSMPTCAAVADSKTRWPAASTLLRPASSLGADYN